MIKKLNPHLAKLANILSDANYHDGNTIGETLQMTRSAVWKLMNKLEFYGIPIQSVKGKGYALLEPLILLDEHEIVSRLNNSEIEVAVFESLESTNKHLTSAKNKKSIKVCLAEQQTGGKGRLNREWYSPFAKNVYFSCLYPFQKDISELAGLSLVTSLAILKSMKELGVDDELCVKWPNDIIYQGKKLSGSLIEIQAETHGACHAVIGVGMNVNMLEDGGQISQPWTSIQKILNRYINRNELVACLINCLLAYLDQFERYGLSFFIDEWMRSDCLMGQVITISNVNGSVQGRVAGINQQGHLLLELENGLVRAYSSGDASIVKDGLY